MPVDSVSQACARLLMTLPKDLAGTGDTDSWSDLRVLYCLRKEDVSFVNWKAKEVFARLGASSSTCHANR